MKKINFIIILILTSIIALLLIERGCSKIETVDKNKQNEMASKDSSYSKIKDINEVKKELGNTDLGKEVKNIESKGEKITTITRTVVKYVHDTSYVENKVYEKTDTRLKYSGVFDDSLISISVSNDVKLKYDSTVNRYVFDTALTKIDNIDFKFGIALVRSMDKDGYLRVRSKPYYINEGGEFKKFIPDNKLKLITDDIMIEKIKKNSNWAVTLSPVSVGYFLTPNGFVFGVGPNIGISYKIFGK